MGAESGQLGVSGGTAWGQACVYVCAQEGNMDEEREKESMHSLCNSHCLAIFSATFTPSPTGAISSLQCVA